MLSPFLIPVMVPVKAGFGSPNSAGRVGGSHAQRRGIDRQRAVVDGDCVVTQLAVGSTRVATMGYVPTGLVAIGTW